MYNKFFEAVGVTTVVAATTYMVLNKWVQRTLGSEAMPVKGLVHLIHKLRFSMDAQAAMNDYMQQIYGQQPEGMASLDVNPDEQVAQAHPGGQYL